MLDKDGYYLWKKGEIFPFNKYFSTREFSCQCKHTECVDQKVSKTLIVKLTTLREQLNEPITINSGFRCAAHQADVETSGVSTVVAKFSQHELGKAADIAPTRTPVKDLVTLAAKLFDAIGIASTWIHVDERVGKERRWYY